MFACTIAARCHGRTFVPSFTLLNHLCSPRHSTCSSESSSYILLFYLPCVFLQKVPFLFSPPSILDSRRNQPHLFGPIVAVLSTYITYSIHYWFIFYTYLPSSNFVPEPPYLIFSFTLNEQLLIQCFDQSQSFLEHRTIK